MLSTIDKYSKIYEYIYHILDYNDNRLINELIRLNNQVKDNPIDYQEYLFLKETYKESLKIAENEQNENKINLFKTLLKLHEV